MLLWSSLSSPCRRSASPGGAVAVVTVEDLEADLEDRVVLEEVLVDQVHGFPTTDRQARALDPDRTPGLIPAPIPDLFPAPIPDRTPGLIPDRTPTPMWPRITGETIIPGTTVGIWQRSVPEGSFSGH